MTISRRSTVFALVGLLLAGAAVATAVAVAPEPTPSDATIAPAEAHEIVQSGALTLVDIRTPREWAETGIPKGAETADFNALSDAAFIARIDRILEGERERPVALICARGGRSSRAWALLREAGFTRVQDVHEGMLGNGSGPGWLARGLPVELREFQ